MDWYKFLPPKDQVRVFSSATPHLSKKQRAQREIAKFESKLKSMKEKIESKKQIVEDSSDEDNIEPNVVISAKRFKHFLALAGKDKDSV